MPDTHWAPAWVAWRHCEGYYGWAPIGPGISIDIAFGNGYNIPHNQWIFAREEGIGRRNINNYYVNVSNNTTIINRSTVINNIYTDRGTRTRYNAGPDRRDVQKRSKSVIAEVSLKGRDRPGQSMSGNELSIYKPRVEKTGNNNRRAAPDRVMKRDEIKSVNERREAVQPRRNVNMQKEQPGRRTENREPVRNQDNRKRKTDAQGNTNVPANRPDIQTREQEIKRRNNVAVQQQREEQQRQVQLKEQKRQEQLTEQKRQGQLEEQKRQGQLMEQKRQGQLEEQKRQGQMMEQKRQGQLEEQKRQGQMTEQQRQEEMKKEQVTRTKNEQLPSQQGKGNQRLEKQKTKRDSVPGR
jgi:hypothetical protein